MAIKAASSSCESSGFDIWSASLPPYLEHVNNVVLLSGAYGNLQVRLDRLNVGVSLMDATCSFRVQNAFARPNLFQAKPSSSGMVDCNE